MISTKALSILLALLGIVIVAMDWLADVDKWLHVGLRLVAAGLAIWLVFRIHRKA